MKRIILLVCLVLLNFVAFAQAPTAAWINEFHYDNVGTDT